MPTSNAQPRPVAVLLAAVAYFALGALWYSPLLFVNPWLHFIGKSFDEVKAHGAAPYPYAFIAALCISYGLAKLFSMMRVVEGAVRSSVAGAAVGIAFAAASAAPSYLFEMRPLGLLAINVGYPVVGMTIVGAILGAFSTSGRVART